MTDDRITVHAGDCLEVLRTIADNSIDSVVTDPPYGLEFMGKGWDSFAPRDRKNASVWDGRRQAQDGWQGDAAERSGKGGGGPAYRSQHKGFKRCSVCGKRAFSGAPCTCAEPEWVIEHRQEAPAAMIAFQNFMTEWATEVYRVLKPGGHMLAFGGSRTYHRLACAVEDAGFEIRDQIMWVFGSGFPKSHDVSKGIDKAAGVEFEARPASGVGFMGPEGPGGYNVTKNQLSRLGQSTPEAVRWSGWGTALKPAHEPIVLARKPLSEATVAANVIRWGTGAINVDGCRVSTSDTIKPVFGGRKGEKHGSKYGHSDDYLSNVSPLGRWPANLIHDGSGEVLAAFPETAPSTKLNCVQRPRDPKSKGAERERIRTDEGYTDSGSAARFFYCAKASKKDRMGSSHPTVKPVKLMQYLVRLITPPGGTVLDPFAGTGTTGQAAITEGCRAILIEREEEYLADIERRFAPSELRP